jgi:hypothetical protein
LLVDISPEDGCPLTDFVHHYRGGINCYVWKGTQEAPAFAELNARPLVFETMEQPHKRVRTAPESPDEPADIAVLSPTPEFASQSAEAATKAKPRVTG